MPGLFALLALAAGCATLIIPSRWDSSPASGLTGLPSAELKGLVIDTSNDNDFLYLRLVTDAESIKCQLMGAFHQSFTIWFEPADAVRGGRDGRGLRISYHRKPGVAYPRRPEEQKEYFRAATREVALLGGDWPGGEQILHPDAKEISLLVEMDQGRLAYSMKIPLRPLKKNSWSLGVEPGENLGLVLITSPIDPEVAEIELIRQYQEQVYGWGWGTGPNPYGPKKGQDWRDGVGLGDYASKGLDKGIYATHGVYRPLSWASVPQRIYDSLTIKLAEQP